MHWISAPSRLVSQHMVRAVTVALSSAVTLIGTGCRGPDDSAQALHFALGARDVEVVFRGELSDAELFGDKVSLLDLVHPRDENSKPRGHRHSAHPGWLHFEYRIDGDQREVLVAKQPLLNRVAWSDIARAGAAMGGGADLGIDGQRIAQDARVLDRLGNAYRVRLPICGQATYADLSEWNLLVGAVHRGDTDFKGERFAWVRSPYKDQDLKVGYKGSLSWCQDEWRGNRVARGYFFVSRFHAAPPELRTDRLHWRPVLERVNSAAPGQPSPSGSDPASHLRWSPSKRVGYAGKVSNSELFGAAGAVDRQLSVEAGRRLEFAAPDWLRFEYQGKSLLVAARPLRQALSWNAIARAGAALGDDSYVRIGWRFYRQGATVVDANGARYRIRLMSCGRSTLDLDSEWNALIGGVHAGDGDFRAAPHGIFGWLLPPLDDGELGVGESADGTATWCRETLRINGKTHAVNRGYLTVSRFHATPTDFDGAGFGWRPVLEPLR